MSIQAIFGKIEFGADEPFREWCLPLDYFFPRRAPDQLMRFARPEFGRQFYRLAIHPPILIETLDPRFFRKIFRRFENALLDQMRLNILIVDIHLKSASPHANNRCSPAQRKVNRTASLERHLVDSATIELG